jgi:hypothetical protein
MQRYELNTITAVISVKCCFIGRSFRSTRVEMVRLVVRFVARAQTCDILTLVSSRTYKCLGVIRVLVRQRNEHWGVGMGFLPCEARPAINVSLDNLTTPVLHLLSGAHL